MIRKIVFLVAAPFNQRTYEMYGIEPLREQGFECEVWDLSKVLKRPQLKETLAREASGNLVIRSVEDLERFRSLIREADLETTVFADFILVQAEIDAKTYPVFRQIRRSGMKLMGVELGLLPDQYSSEAARSNLWARLMARTSGVLRRGNYADLLFRKITSFLRAHEIAVARPALIFGQRAPKLDAIARKLGLPESSVKGIHSFDYDVYLSKPKPLARLVDREYAVFLWPNLAATPDPKLLFGEHWLESFGFENYHGLLNRLFARIEKELGLEVVISVHPRSSEYPSENPFEGRRMVVGNTMELICHSKLVVAHASTATNLAVLFNKEILLVLTRELGWLHEVVTSAYGFANSLGTRVYELERDEVPLQEVLSRSDEERRAAYRYHLDHYVRNPEAVDRRNWEIVGQAIRGEF